MKFEIRFCDSWLYGDNWTINESCYMGKLKTNAKNEERAIKRWIRKYYGFIRRNNGKLRFTSDGDIYTLEDWKTGEPLYIAIPV